MVAGRNFNSKKTEVYEKARKFKNEWKNDFAWVSETSDGRAYCEICKSSLDPKKSRLEQHEVSKKHEQQEKICNFPKIIDHPKVETKGNDLTKIAEMQLAAEIAIHCPLMAVDHLTEAISSNSVCSKKGCINPLTDLKMHRTKCTKLITNVIGKYMKDQLKSSIPTHYSVLIDEWSDVSYKPHLAVIVSYSDKLDGSIKQSFLALRELQSSNSEAIFSTMIEVLKEFGLKLENCVSFASDGANVVAGKNNSVFTRLKQFSPNLVQIKCICHSLAKCAEYAFNKLPSCLAFLLKNIPKWFSKSQVRKDAFMDLFARFEGSDVFRTPFDKYSETRWLARGKVCRNLINNWDILKEYFSQILSDLRGEPKFKCMLILENLNDQNLAYFKFATPIIETCENANALFQKDKIDPVFAFEEVQTIFRSISRRIKNANGQPLVTELTNFGTDFNAMNPTLDVMQRCRDFLNELALQLESRIQDNMDLIESLNLFAPEKILMNKALFKNLPENPLKTSEVEELYNQIEFVNWKEFVEEPTKMGVEDFWKMVRVKKNGKYEKLADYALLCLSIPLSNAIVERIFSQAGAVKSKIRNRLTIENLDAIVRVRTYRKVDVCFNKFDFKPFLYLFNNSMYC